MGAKTVVFIIIVIIGLGIGLYLYNSGAFTKGVNGVNSLFPAPGSSASSTSAGSSTSSSASSSTSSGSSFWSFLFPSAFNASYAGPSIPPPQQQAPTIGPVSGGSSGSSGNTNPNLNNPNIPAGFTASQLSPYFHDVRLSGISAGTSYSYGTITLSDDDYASPTSTIDITGWQIKARDGGEYIPQAIDVYDPSGLTPASDIMVKEGNTVYLYSSSAPFNLRLNECIGYIANVAKFTPPLPLSCPQVNQSQIQNFTGECQNYIDSIGGCQQPNMSSPEIPRNDFACQDYLENNFTYKSCFEAHEGDANFLSNQVWVWTGGNVVDRYHDSVELLDRNGLLVDISTY